ncbi:MAG TPA: CBS domain-containing protein [Nannocystis exedens]|nr:CBS domain-containing protein [Nannocystis exedens]
MRHLPVLNGGQLCGILSDRDIRKFRPPEALLEGNVVAWIALLDTPIWKVMTPEVLSVSPEDCLDRALDFFVNLRVGAVCVVDAGRLVGIVSYIDALRALRDQRRSSS